MNSKTKPSTTVTIEDSSVFTELILHRLDRGSDVSGIDSFVKSQYIREVTVVMYGSDYAAVTRTYGVEYAVALRHEAFRLLSPIVAKHHGECMEEALWVFEEAADALSAILAAKAALIEYNATVQDEAQIPFTGFGSHSGSLLVGPGTDIHWGDPVNVSSKLGEDIAKNGEIFISDVVHDAIIDHHLFEGLRFHARTKTVSKNRLECYVVVDPKLEPVHHFHGSYAVVVTDMSGFTRITRKHGIIHFGALILRMREILAPLWKAYEAEVIDTEADNFLVLFSNPINALAAAMQVYDTVAVFNNGRPEDECIKIGGVGVAYGEGVLRDNFSERFYGLPRDVAFSLGEDVAEDGEVLCDVATFSASQGIPEFSDLQFVKRRDDDTGLEHYCVVGRFNKGIYRCEDSVADVGGTAVNETDKSEFITMMLKRSMPHANVADIDTVLRARFMRKASVVMYGAAWPEVARKHGTEHMVSVKQRAFQIAEMVMLRHGGQCVEEALFVLFDASAAMAAVLELRDEFERTNAGSPPEWRVPVTGYGSHSGELLIAKGTDVHWGDPVNTSSKLGEDVAKNGEVFVTQPLYEVAQKDPRFVNLKWEARMITVSKTDLHCYIVTGKMQSTRHFEGPRAVLVTDMSGFTRVTKKYGIVHFASLILKMREIMTHLFLEYEAELVEYEADNCFVVFENPVNAMAAGLQVFEIATAFNKSANESQQITIGGVGIAYGDGLMQDLATSKLYGTPVDRAFVLGEDVADDGDVLVDTFVYENVDGAAPFEGLPFTFQAGTDNVPDHYSVGGSFGNGIAEYQAIAHPHGGELLRMLCRSPSKKFATKAFAVERAPVAISAANTENDVYFPPRSNIYGDNAGAVSEGKFSTPFLGSEPPLYHPDYYKTPVFGSDFLSLALPSTASSTSMHDDKRRHSENRPDVGTSPNFHFEKGSLGQSSGRGGLGRSADGGLYGGLGVLGGGANGQSIRYHTMHGDVESGGKYGSSHEFGSGAGRLERGGAGVAGLATGRGAGDTYLGFAMDGVRDVSGYGFRDGVSGGHGARVGVGNAYRDTTVTPLRF